MFTKSSPLTRFKPLLLIPLSAALWPGSLAAWTPGDYPVGSSGFTVDTAVRNDVVSFWHGVYQASEGYQARVGWTGNYTAPAPGYNGQGTTSAAFVADVARRVNYHRAMCSVPATALFNTTSTVVINPTDTYRTTTTPALAATTTKATAVQQGAYMISRTYGASGVSPTGKPYAGFSHNPVAADCAAWTTAAWNANHYGNIGLGFYGPGAVDAYILENVAGLSDWNSAVGHRRWLLYPPATNFATGDTPGSYDSATNAYWSSSNVIYVTQSAAETATPPNRFVPYPPAGFFPAPLNAARFWSLSYPGAGFGVATVTMTTAGGVAVPVAVASRATGFGSAAIVWNVAGTAAAVAAVTADTTFNVTVAGITGAGVPSSYSYSVTLINPNQITSDQALFGATSPAAGTSATYKFTPPAKAEAIQVNSFQPQTTAWTEGAEDSPAPQVTSRTTGTYEFRSTVAFAGLPSFGPITGAKSFLLTFPVTNDGSLSGAPQQSFELDRELLPSAAASLNFKFRRGYLTPGSSLAIESSSDGGVTWSQLGDRITGNATGVPDAAAGIDARSLAATTVPVRVRFRLFDGTGGGVYPAEIYPTLPMGMFIDDITTTNCQWLELKKTNDLAAAATSFQLNATTAGVALDNNLALRLRLRTKLGNRWMPYGEMKSLTVTSANPTATPQFSPAAGEYAAGQALTLTSEAGATIFYRVNGGVTQSAASPVTGLTVPAYPATLAISAYAQKAGRADSALAEATYTSSVFKTWAGIYFPGVTDPNTIGPAADPDKDGQPNALEFGLGGNPNAGGGRAKLYPLTSDGTPTRKLLLTIAVRTGTPAFTGTPSPTATYDGITYAVLGGLSPNLADSPVAVATVQTTGLPAAPAGYEYRTFRLVAADGLPSRGFMRVRVTTAP